MSKINKCPIIPQKNGTITNQLGSSLTKTTLSPFHTESVPAIWSSTKSSYPHIIIVHIQTGPQSLPPLCHTVQHENEVPKQEAPDCTSHVVEWTCGKQNVANISEVLCVQLEMHWSIHAWCLSNYASRSSACLGTWNVIHQWLLVYSDSLHQKRPDRAMAESKRFNSSLQFHYFIPVYTLTNILYTRGQNCWYPW